MSADKTEEATPKKLADARQKGQVARSAEFTSTAVAVAALAAFVLTAGAITGHLAGFLRQAIQVAFSDPVPSALVSILYEGLIVLAWVVGPIVAVAFVVAAFVGYVQVGPVFAIKPLLPDSKRLDPFKGLQKLLFSKERLVELAKNLVKLSVMILIGVAVFETQLARLLRTPRLGLEDALSTFGLAAMELAQYLVGGLIVFAIFDLLWQRHKFAKDMMMSKREVKEEYKQSEGDPQMKGKRKQMHRELLSDAGVSAVRDADAVVVNPTHVSVAIRYREEEMEAPKVIARGRGEIARQIRKLARRHRIPIIRNVALARSLVELDVDEEIPEDLYEAVAEVLRFVYELR